MPTISGMVYDDTGNPVANRIVRAYRRDNGAMLAQTISSYGESVLVDPHYDNVSLLLHMDGANNSTVFTDMSPSPKTVTPGGNAQISTAQSKFGNASAYFDGTGDYLSLASSTDFALSGDFTIEFWVRINSTSAVANGRGLVSSGWSYGTYAPFLVYQTPTTGSLSFYAWSTGATWNVVNGLSIKATPTLNTWYHIAIVRSGSTFSTYCDGVLTATTTSATALPSSAVPLLVGGSTVAADSFNGYIDDLRITKGVARYTGNFTPSIQPHYPLTPDDPYYANVRLLLPMDGVNNSTTFIDRSPVTKPITRFGNAQISTAQSKFGGSSAYFDGNDAVNTRIEISDSPDFHFPGAYTIEFWVRPLSFKATASWLIQQSNKLGGYCPVRIDMNSTGAITVYGSSNNIDWLFTTGMTTSNMSLNTWYHVALSDDGTTCRLFLDGVMAASRATWSKIDSTDPLLIGGGFTNGDREFNGYIDDLRITEGIARYTANFTPPSQSGFSVNPGSLGEYTIQTSYAGECNVICLDDAAGTTYNDLIHRVIPG